MKTKYTCLEYDKCDLIIEKKDSNTLGDRLMFTFKNDAFYKKEVVFISGFDAKELGKDLLKEFGVLDSDLLLKENVDLKEYIEGLINDKRISITNLNALEDENKRLKADIERMLSTLNQ